MVPDGGSGALSQIAMDPTLAFELANAAKALDRTLADIQSLVNRNHDGEPLQQLLRRAHDLIEIVDKCVSQIKDARLATGARTMAERLSAELKALERDIAGRPAAGR